MPVPGSKTSVIFPIVFSKSQPHRHLCDYFSVYKVLIYYSVGQYIFQGTHGFRLSLIFTTKCQTLCEVIFLCSYQSY